MARTELILKLIKETGYTRPKYGYGYEDVNIYKFQDENEKIYVWKTTNVLSREFVVGKILHWEFIPVGSVIKISASIKGEIEYRGEKQIVLQRVKVIDIIDKALTKEEILENKKKEQLDSLQDGDFIWEGMSYRQYKEHYSDCETVAGSFKEPDQRDQIARIDVIIRDGRLKNSGVRGEHFYTFKLENAEGKWITFRAVNEQNAIKQANKLYPETEWKCVDVYYGNRF